MSAVQPNDENSARTKLYIAMVAIVVFLFFQLSRDNDNGARQNEKILQLGNSGTAQRNIPQENPGISVIPRRHSTPIEFAEIGTASLISPEQPTQLFALQVEELVPRFPIKFAKYTESNPRIAPANLEERQVNGEYTVAQVQDLASARRTTNKVDSIPSHDNSVSISDSDEMLLDQFMEESATEEENSPGSDGLSADTPTAPSGYPLGASYRQIEDDDKSTLQSSPPPVESAEPKESRGSSSSKKIAESAPIRYPLSIDSRETPEQVDNQSKTTRQPTADDEANELIAEQDAANTVSDETTIEIDDEQAVVSDVQQIQNEQIFGRDESVSISLNEALARALHKSSQLAVLQFNALESQQVAGEEFGNFDPVAFLESRFGQRNEPTANQFQVNNAAQGNILSQDLNVRSGVRQNTQSGGQLSVASSLQFFDDDSGILQPPDQAISRLELNFSQELLRDSGRKVVLNRVLVAEAVADGQSSDALANIASLLNNVASAYWELFVSRGKVIVAREQVNFASKLVKRIVSRVEFDGEKNLVFQAQSTLLQRQIELGQAIAQAKQSQDRLVRLIGDPVLMDPTLELITLETPVLENIPIHLESEIQVAYENRPEIRKALADIKAANLSHHFTLNQLLPRLTLDIRTSLAGLAGNRDFGAAFEQQFNSPTYQVGMNMEVPLENLRSRFANRKAELAAQRVVAEFRNTLDSVQLDVKLAARRLDYLGVTISTLNEVIANTYRELDIIFDRTFIAPRNDEIPSVQLNLLLDAQNRISLAKGQFLDSIRDQQQSLIDMRRSTGTLCTNSILYADSGPSDYNCRCLHQQLRQDGKEYHPEISRVTTNIQKLNGCVCESCKLRRRQKRSAVEAPIHAGEDESVEH